MEHNLPSVLEVPRGFFRENGVKYVILDVDNTSTGRMYPRLLPKVVSEIKRWGKEEGIEGVVLVSNVTIPFPPAPTNRIASFARELDAKGYVPAALLRTPLKPNPAPFYKALEMLGPDADIYNTCAIGDDPKKDIRGAKLAGLRVRVQVVPMYPDSFWNLLSNFIRTLVVHNKGAV